VGGMSDSTTAVRFPSNATGAWLGRGWPVEPLSLDGFAFSHKMDVSGRIRIPESDASVSYLLPGVAPAHSVH
jgi:hypothetical protein